MPKNNGFNKQEYIEESFNTIFNIVYRGVDALWHQNNAGSERVKKRKTKMKVNKNT